MSRKTFDNPNSTEARQALLDNRNEGAGKNHRVNKRKKKLAATKKVAHAATRAKNDKNRAAKLTNHRAFWAGAADERVD